MRTRRYKVLYLSEEHVAAVIQEKVCSGFPYQIKGSGQLPSDAVFIRSFLDYTRNAYGFIFAHPTFEEVDEGAEIPALSGVSLTLVQLPEEKTPETDTLGAVAVDASAGRKTAVERMVEQVLNESYVSESHISPQSFADLDDLLAAMGEERRLKK